MTVIPKLSDIRRKRKLTQEELARKANISTSYVQKFEQGNLTRYSSDYLDKLCEALDCNVSDLLEYVKPTK